MKKQILLMAGLALILFSAPAFSATVEFFNTLPGNEDDEVQAIATDSSGNVYVVGHTLSQNFARVRRPARSERGVEGGSYDVFITKLSATGAQIFSIYLGGTREDWGYGIAVSGGNIYVTGKTKSIDFPTTEGALKRTITGEFGDAFVTKLNASSGAIVYSTYLGGGVENEGRGIAVDAAGNAYVTGWTTSENFPTTIGAYQTERNGDDVDAFVAKLNPAGSSLIYSTYFGGSLFERADGIVLDWRNRVWITGTTQSPDFPVEAPFQSTFGGGWNDAFVAVLNPEGSALYYSTYLGGSDMESGYGIARDPLGKRIFVIGSTTSGNFPVTESAYQESFGGAGDTFVIRFHASTRSVHYSTYLGGSNEDWGRSIVANRYGYAFVTGTTNSDNFPTTPSAIQENLNGLSDTFVTVLNPRGSALHFSTYLGTALEEEGQGIAIHGNHIFMTGMRRNSGGNLDTFVAKIRGEP